MQEKDCGGGSFCRPVSNKWRFVCVYLSGCNVGLVFCVTLVP